MSMELIVIIYLGVATGVAGFVFFHGVVRQRRHPLFGVAEQATLAFVCLAIGSIWILFMPAAVARAIPQVRRALEGRMQGPWIPAAKTLRFRG